MRIRSIVAVVVTTATAGSVLFGAQVANGQTVTHFVIPGNSVAVRVMDIDHDGLRLGDRLVGRGPLFDESMTERVGTSFVDCVIHRRIVDPASGIFNCTYVLELADGEIMLQGLDQRGPGTSEFAVFGGTGAYAGAAGDGTFTDTDTESGGQTDIVIRLSK